MLWVLSMSFHNYDAQKLSIKTWIIQQFTTYQKLKYWRRWLLFNSNLKVWLHIKIMLLLQRIGIHWYKEFPPWIMHLFKIKLVDNRYNTMIQKNLPLIMYDDRYHTLIKNVFHWSLILCKINWRNNVAQKIINELLVTKKWSMGEV